MSAESHDKIPPGFARVHYYRPDNQFDNWVVYTFGDTAERTDDFNAGSVTAAGEDRFGAYFDIKLKPDAKDLGLVVHDRATGVKDPGPDMHLDVSQRNEAWVVSCDIHLYAAQPGPAQILSTGFCSLQAFWINRTTAAIQSKYFEPDWNYSLVCSPEAGLYVAEDGVLDGVARSFPLTLHPDGLSNAERTQFPQLAAYTIFHLAEHPDTQTLEEALRGQVVLAASNQDRRVRYLTGVQWAGVLDDLFTYQGALGVTFTGTARENITVRVWAPTAQSVKLLLYASHSEAAPRQTLPMTANRGVWSASGDAPWKGKYYLFAVSVYVPRLRRIVENIVTDPYSLHLALNGTKTRIADLRDVSTKPDNWDAHASPPLRSKSDFSVYELHVRDFSANDVTVPAEHRGTYLAFTHPASNGMRHLTRLAACGIKAIHLLPTFHFGTVNEDKALWKSPGDLSTYPPDSPQPQDLITQIQHDDGYNWGYDPVHFFAPEGSYAVNPDERVKEYRKMVLALHQAGLRVVQDLVFNHTDGSGQSGKPSLDKIVPNYYYRLDENGDVRSETCCSDTASEHRMMEKLMIDAIVNSAREYKIDSFRFDLMGFHFVSNMQRIQNALSHLTPEHDGADGSQIYLYGEGWEIGAPARNALGKNASQVNMFGTGVGTFNDRLRDGIRGGTPFADPRVQGFATGLLTAPSDYTRQQQPPSDQYALLLKQIDLIKLSLAGNLRDFVFLDSTGRTVKGSELEYNGGGAGYTASPLEVVNFCSVHDNLALFDALQLKSAATDDIATRARRQILALSLLALGQGVPFFHGGDDLLRSKSMDGNSFDSGDWFNRLDFSYGSNNWGVGLPHAKDNRDHWPLMQPLLADPALTPTPSNIAYARDAFQELLRIRYSSPLFRMQTLSEVQTNLQFLNNGPHQVPGLIVMSLQSNDADYGPFQRILVFFNAQLQPVVFQDNALMSLSLALHPVQIGSADPVVRRSAFDPTTGNASVPGLTAAVFVSECP